MFVNIIFCLHRCYNANYVYLLVSSLILPHLCTDVVVLGIITLVCTDVICLFSAVEAGTDGSIPFLDLLITPKAEGILTTKVYRKPTLTNIFSEIATTIWLQNTVCNQHPYT